LDAIAIIATWPLFAGLRLLLGLPDETLAVKVVRPQAVMLIAAGDIKHMLFDEHDIFVSLKPVLL
jgi:hypothetical protein